MNHIIGDISVKTITCEEKKLVDYAGNVLLIVNVASYCGYTPQYNGLEDLYQTFKNEGLKILAFPCNDFGGQEHGTNEEIVEFCNTRYHTTFELFDKIHAKGPEQHTLYARLTGSFAPVKEVAWNFEKFLINRQGEVVARFGSSVRPESEQMVEAVQAELSR